MWSWRFWTSSSPPNSPDTKSRSVRTSTRLSNINRVEGGPTNVARASSENISLQYPSPVSTPGRVNEQSIYPPLESLHFPSVPTTPPRACASKGRGNDAAKVNQHPAGQGRPCLPSPPSSAPRSFPVINSLRFPSAPTTPPRRIRGHTRGNPASEADLPCLPSLPSTTLSLFPDLNSTRHSEKADGSSAPLFTLPTPPASSTRPPQNRLTAFGTPTRGPSTTRTSRPTSPRALSPIRAQPPPLLTYRRPQQHDAGRISLPSPTNATSPKLRPEQVAQRVEDDLNTVSKTSGHEAAARKLAELMKRKPSLITTGIFASGQKLQRYQLKDVQCLVMREEGEEVCGTNVINRVGLLLAYDMGLGKTVVSIALILCNPPPEHYGAGRATLVVVPSIGIMKQWLLELRKFAPHLVVCYYDSISKALNSEADVVLITYRQLQIQRGHLLADTDKDKKNPVLYPVFQFTWYRVINDEAQVYRNPTTKTSEAIWALRKQHGLCLSGTPVQNKMLDFYPIFRFLDVTYDGVNELPVFERKIYSRKQKGPIVSSQAEERLEIIKQSFCIFRRKDDIDPETGKPLVVLPPRTETIVRLKLSSAEGVIYDQVWGMKLPIFACLIRRRQACDHPSLLLGDKQDDTTCRENDHDEGQEEHRKSRPIRVENFPEAVRPLFSHSFKSSKMKAMVGILHQCRNEKTIIFTHFTSLIPAIAEALYIAQIAWVEYTGDMTSKEREDALTRIAKDEDCNVIIVSIKPGGLGLNMTSCNNVILTEPWWNPYVEEQAISRVHRLGQTRPVKVYRLVVSESIEESILKTQELKREMVGDMYGESGAACGELDEATLQAWLNGP